MNFISNIKSHLDEKMIPFWASLLDEENGGFYGEVDIHLDVKNDSEKCSLTLSRYLYAFSRYAIDVDKSYKKYADQAYQFLMEYFYDTKNKGVFFLSDYKGNIVDSRKHTYVQGFFIYGLTEYYKLTKNKDVLDIALETFEVIEKKMFDFNNNGYLEEFTEDFKLKDNELTSEHGITAYFTTNTHLHILEAYTNLYEVTKKEVVKKRLLYLIDLFQNKIRKDNYYQVFFNEKFESILYIISHGHDIETTWLIDRAVKIIGLDHKEYFSKNLKDIVDYCMTFISDDNAMILEQVNKNLYNDRIWWVQAEALVGYFNAYQHTNDEKYLKVTENIWDFVTKHMIDPRNNSEWFGELDQNNVPKRYSVAQLWKTPYHTVRSCVEMIERKNDEKTY